jgi:hypothetical protein
LPRYNPDLYELALRWLEYTKKKIVSQGNFSTFSTRPWVCFRAFSAGIREVFRVEVERELFQRFAEVWQVSLRLSRAHRFLPPGIPDL